MAFNVGAVFAASGFGSFIGAFAGAGGAVTGLTGKMVGMTAAAGPAGVAVTRFAAAAAAMATTLGAAIVGVGALAAGVTAAGFAMVSVGGTAEKARLGLELLGKQAGVDTVALMDRLTESVASQVTQVDLQQFALGFLQSGLRATSDELATITEGMKIVAERTGKDFNLVLNQISTSLASGRVTALQQSIGILDLKKAYDSFAETLGKTANELTETERGQAALNSIIERSGKIIEEADGFVENNADIVERFKVAWSDASDQFLRFLSTSPIIEEALNTITAAAGEMSKFFEANKRDIEIIIAAGIKLAAVFLSVLAPVLRILISLFAKLIENARIAGTVIGAVAGFISGGPLGAIAGAAAGFAIGSAIQTQPGTAEVKHSGEIKVTGLEGLKLGEGDRREFERRLLEGTTSSLDKLHSGRIRASTSTVTAAAG